MHNSRKEENTDLSSTHGNQTVVYKNIRTAFIRLYDNYNCNSNYDISSDFDTSNENHDSLEM